MFVDVIVLESDIQDALLTRLRLRRTPGMRCRVRHIAHLADLPRAVEHCTPAVIITDVLLPDVWGSLTVARIQALAPWVPVVVLTAFEAPGLDEDLVRMGIAARLDKSDEGYGALPQVVADVVVDGHVGGERVRPWPMSA